jgi:50S ribosomal subunit-associated GTPase HflX
MIDQEVVNKLSVTRAKLEAAASGPAVIAVTSARTTDGTDLLARGLALSLASVTEDVLLVQAASNPQMRAKDRLAFASPGHGSPTLAELQSSYSFEDARAAFDEYRKKYQFTIVVAEQPTKNGSVLSLLGAADFVIVSLEDGRSSKAEDKELAALLRSANTNVLGVVTIASRAIARYNATVKVESGVRDLRRADVAAPTADLAVKGVARSY